MAAAIFLAVERGRKLRASRALGELPTTARVVISLDTKALRKSASAGILVDAFLDESQLSDIEAKCQLDPIRDLAEIVVWVRGSEARPLESFGVQLEGREIDSQAIAECHAALVGERGGSVVRVEAPTGPVLASEDRRSALAVIDDRTVVTGSVQTVGEAMAVRRGLLPSLGEREVIAEVWQEIRRDAALAAILDLPSHWKAALGRIPPFDAEPSWLDAVRTISVSAKTGAETTATLRMDAETPEMALDVAERFEEWAMHPPEGMEPPWTRVLESAQVSTHGATAIVTLDVSALRREPARR